MALLSGLARAPRRRRNTSPGSAPHASGLPADDDVLLDVPEEPLGPALVAAARGEHGPAADLLADTRARAAWDERDRYTRRLAAFAGPRPAWFERWLAAAPADPDALLVAAQLAVDRAGRSPARAEALRAVGPPVGAAAAGGDARDPVPWRIALDHAGGTDAPPERFARLWEQAVRRAQHHYGCHVAALGYLSAACRAAGSGSGTCACLDFAEPAAQDAPADSLLQALPLHAALGRLAGGNPYGPGERPGPQAGAGPGPGARLDAAADRAIALSARFAPGDPWPAPVRNQLAYVLVRLGRRADALEQFRLIGPHATSAPWDLATDDPLGHFLRVRHDVGGPEQV
ncbi:hypothetical protein [Streptomyces sp. NPDC008150]|uniref:hypothetical protein n=1 Tax=Streptomyces sp. NPDC008150 TaxID=3364816 RepID=UPI0036EE8AF4